MLDEELAGLYEVSTKRLNEQVKPNLNPVPGGLYVSVDFTGVH